MVDRSPSDSGEAILSSSDRRWHPRAKYKVKDLHHKQPAVAGKGWSKASSFSKVPSVVVWWIYYE